MGVKLSNNARTFLTTGLSNSATTIVVDDTVAFPNVSETGDYFYATLYNADGDVEIVKVNSTDANSMTVERAQQNTDAAGWDVNDNIELRLTAGTLSEFIGQMPVNLDITTGKIPFDRLFVAEAPTAATAYLGYDPDGINQAGDAEGVLKWNTYAAMVRGIEAGVDADKLDYVTGLKNKPAASAPDPSSGGGSDLGFSSHGIVPVRYTTRDPTFIFRSSKFLTHSHFALIGGETNDAYAYTIFKYPNFSAVSYYPDTPSRLIMKSTRIGNALIGMRIVRESSGSTDAKLYIMPNQTLWVFTIEFFNFS